MNTGCDPGCDPGPLSSLSHVAAVPLDRASFPTWYYCFAPVEVTLSLMHSHVAHCLSFLGYEAEKPTRPGRLAQTLAVVRVWESIVLLLLSAMAAQKV